MDTEDRFTDLYVSNHDRVHKFLGHRFRDVDTEGLVTETFILAWRKLKGRESVDASWLFVTANYLALNAIKSQSQKRLTFVATDTLDDSMYTDSPEIEDRLAATQAFQRLSIEDREILVSLAWDDLSVREIAAVLKCSVPTTYVRIHRARKRLHQLILPERDTPQRMEAEDENVQSR